MAVFLLALLLLSNLIFSTSLAASTLSIELSHNLEDSRTVYAYITGTTPDGSLFLLQSDGKTPYYPTNPDQNYTPLSADCAIPVSYGDSINTTVPLLGGARIWFSIGDKLTFTINKGDIHPALVQPSVTNPADANINTKWDFIEFTYDDAGVHVDVSYIDFVSFNVGVQLDTTTGMETVYGLYEGQPATDSHAIDTICAALRAQEASDGLPWSSLIVKDATGAVLRVLGPQSAIKLNPSLFEGYFEPYVAQVWSHYTESPLCIDTQSAAGTVNGTVQGTHLIFPPSTNFPTGASFAPPSTSDIFSCSTGPFLPSDDKISDAIGARIAAAFHRGTLLLDDGEEPWPSVDGEGRNQFYTVGTTNHYARVLHQVEVQGRGYAFPYDDVHSSRGGRDQSGYVEGLAGSMLVVLGNTSGM